MDEEELQLRLNYLQEDYDTLDRDYTRLYIENKRLIEIIKRNHSILEQTKKVFGEDAYVRGMEFVMNDIMREVEL